LTASSKGFEECVKILIAAGASLESVDSDEGWNALHFAANNDHAKVYQVLVKKKAELLNVKDKKGKKPDEYKVEVAASPVADAEERQEVSELSSSI